MEHIKIFIKNETVLVIAAILTIISMFFVFPGMGYLEYINFPVLGILFCLMAVVAGFQKIGVFDLLSSMVLSRTRDGKKIGIILVGLCFFTAMLITNDVALITFVPFTIGILGQDDDKLIFVIVMETIGANLGSMLTPIGNPQNLFLYSYYGLSIFKFLSIMLLPCILSLILITITMCCRKESSLNLNPGKNIVSIDRGQLLMYSGMFVICLLTVLHIINYIVCFVIISLLLFINDKSIFRKIDYMLLLTFICFFIFVGNMSSLESVKYYVGKALAGREMLASSIISQCISNVPAAIMLAPFTDNAAKLLTGVNIGGLGTPIASMASLISYKYYGMKENSRKGKYMIVFSMYNFIFLIILLFSMYLINYFAK